MRITLIHNPGAGRTDHRGKDELVALIEEAGHSVRYQSSKDDDWEEALNKPSDLVVAAGGDGTVGRVARGMVGRNVPVSVLPAGTANNIARTLGLADRSPEELVRGWAEARRVKLDIGMVSGPFGKRSFVEGDSTAPPDPTTMSVEVLYSSRFASSASASGRAMASPTMISMFTPSSETRRQIVSGSKRPCGVTTIFPPPKRTE